MDTYQDIYESMIGVRNPEYALPWVENAFADDSVCEQAYGEMRDAYARLCDRLGVADEDPDLEIMVNSLETIQRDLCRRMYAHGLKAASINHP